MRKTIFLVGFFLVSVLANGQSKKVYLFSTFHEPANEGLLLATSRDGYHWEDLGCRYMKPEIGTE